MEIKSKPIKDKKFMHENRRGFHPRDLCESPIEQYVYDYLKEAGVSTQPQWPVGKYWIDLAIPEKKIAIECDGKQHKEDEQIKKDAEKDRYLINNDWWVIRLTGVQIYLEMEKSIGMIKSLVGQMKVIRNEIDDYFKNNCVGTYKGKKIDCRIEEEGKFTFVGNLFTDILCRIEDQTLHGKKFD